MFGYLTSMLKSAMTAWGNLVSRKQGAFESQDCGLLCLDLSKGDQKVSAWNEGVVNGRGNLRNPESKFRVSNCRNLRT